MKSTPLNVLFKLIGREATLDVAVTGGRIDSRLVKEGDLFFALSGERTDGHNFLEEAAQKGAVAAVVKTSYEGPDFGLPLVRVDDVLQTLQKIGSALLKKSSAKVVAITGSLGKTTTKYFTKTLLESTFNVYATPGNYNTKATIPVCLMEMSGEEDVLVLEFGITEPGEIGALVEIAPPDIGVLTTVAIQHASSFPDGLAGIKREKMKIFSHPQTQTKIIPYELSVDDEITFSTENQMADFYYDLRSRAIFPKGEALVEMKVDFPMPSVYHNFLAAVTIARTLGVSWEKIQGALPDLKLPPMRFERVERQGIHFINDAYNANPDAMKAALESLPPPEEGKKTIAVLSEMDALGMYTEGGHAMVAETALEHADLLLCVGGLCETMRKIWKEKKRPVELFETRAALEAHLKSVVEPGDVVLLKGARSHALDQILARFE